MNIPVLLLDGVTADTPTPNPVSISGDRALIIEGDLGGGTVTLEVRHADESSEWRTAKDDTGTDYTFTDKADTPVSIRGYSALQYRAPLSGSTTPDCTVKFV